MLSPMAFRIPLNLPHAGKIAGRIASCLDDRADWATKEHQTLLGLVRQLQGVLLPCQVDGENPPEAEALRVRDAAAGLARELVAEIVRLGFQGDRLGQCVRNLFECLELGDEGARISLEAGEDPKSPQRP